MISFKESLVAKLTSRDGIKGFKGSGSIFKFQNSSNSNPIKSVNSKNIRKMKLLDSFD